MTIVSKIIQSSFCCIPFSSISMICPRCQFSSLLLASTCMFTLISPCGTVGVVFLEGSLERGNLHTGVVPVTAK